MRRYLVKRPNQGIEASSNIGRSGSGNDQNPNTGSGSGNTGSGSGNDEQSPNTGSGSCLGGSGNAFYPDEIVCDPALRRQIASYAPDFQDQVRRAYILKGPTQPIVNFPRVDGRKFSRSWFQRYNWIEYSVSKDAAFCFYCFLFKNPGRGERFGYEVFTKTGFKDWKHAYKALPEHVGGLGSDHNNCVRHCDDFKNQNQSVATKLARVTDESK